MPRRWNSGATTKFSISHSPAIGLTQIKPRRSPVCSATSTTPFFNNFSYCADVQWEAVADCRSMAWIEATSLAAAARMIRGGIFEGGMFRSVRVIIVVPVSKKFRRQSDECSWLAVPRDQWSRRAAGVPTPCARLLCCRDSRLVRYRFPRNERYLPKEDRELRHALLQHSISLPSQILPCLGCAHCACEAACHLANGSMGIVHSRRRRRPHDRHQAEPECGREV